MPLIAGSLLVVFLTTGFVILMMVRRLRNSPNRVIAYAAQPHGPIFREIEKRREEEVKQGALLLADYAARRQRTRIPISPKIPPKDGNDTGHDDYSSPPMLSLFVEDQSTNIGRRNIHAVKQGYGFSVGGGNSDFLIFLVPIPAGIAEIRNDGRQCAFIPRKPEFFPDLGSQPLQDCVGIPIRLVSEKQYELILRIDQYEDPLMALNRLLNSIHVPGV
ncbi:MAG: hypothetical protein LBU28_08300 [Spirochaetaceae bacterium]|jgi:hypothetical protein|nr:hypothetical protein [Spirochaetaceae bacterium]